MLSVSFAESVYPVGEGDGIVTLCLELLDIIEQTERDIEVELAAFDGSLAIGEILNP